MTGTQIHTMFDLLAWIVALGAWFVLRRTWFADSPVESKLRFGYAACVLAGAGIGAWAFGTLNLWISDLPGFGRSIEGAIVGGIFAVELYKKLNGISERTGAIYALPLALGVAVGRIGCLLSGLSDNTHGIPIGANWARTLGWDFGDGIPRHPVQLYESLAMAGFAIVYLVMMARGSAYWRVNGFYLAVGFYAVQRFVWEFLKPYEPAIAGLTLFQLLSVALVAYATERIMGGMKFAAA